MGFRPPRLWRRRLWVRLTLICVGAAVVPTLIGGLWITADLEAAAHARATARLHRAAELAAGQTARFTQRARAKLINLSRLLALQSAARDSQPVDLEFEVLGRLRSQVDPPGLFLGIEHRGLEPAQNIAVQQMRLPTEPVAGEVAADLPPIAPTRDDRFGRITAAIAVDAAGVLTATAQLVGYLDFADLQNDLESLCDGLALDLVDQAGSAMITAGTHPGPDDTELVMAPVPDTAWRIEARGSRSSAVAAAAAARSQVWRTTLVAGAGATVLALLVAAWLARPIARLRRTATAMAEGDLSARAGLQRRDEIGELGQAFDRMAAAVEQLDRVRSDFVATVSHELRTPLTALRANVENLTDGIHGELGDAQRTAADRLAREIVRLQEIVDATLTLSRLEAGAEPLRATDCDLRALADEVAAGQAADSKLQVEGSGSAIADPRLLRRALGNVVENALRHGGGAVTITVEDGAITVRDRGRGFDLADPFAPFAQGTTDGNKNSGVGLGLAIVARIVRMNGGEVTAQTDDGAVVTMRLPNGPQTSGDHA